MISNPAGLLAEPHHIGLEWRGKGIIKNDACKNLQASLYIVLSMFDIRCCHRQSQPNLMLLH